MIHMEKITTYNDPRQQQAMANIAELTNSDARVDNVARGKGGHVKNWDAKTALNLSNLETRMNMAPPPQAWAINLHPFPISVNGGRMIKDILPPAGIEIFSGTGKDRKLMIHRFATQGAGEAESVSKIGVGVVLLPWHEIDMTPMVDGSHNANPITPIEQAEQYAREGNSSELWGAGVLIYEGDMPPDEAYATNAQVPRFDRFGKPITKDHVVMVTPRGSRTPEKQVRQQPVMGLFRDLVNEFFAQRTASYLRIVKDADAKWQTAEGKEKRWWVTDYTRLMAQVLFAEKKIPKLPAWILPDSLDIVEAEKEETCVNCGAPRKGKALMCAACPNPFNVLEAYRRSLISFEHGSISTLSDAELAEAYKIKDEREKKHAKAQKKAGIKPKDGEDSTA